MSKANEKPRITEYEKGQHAQKTVKEVTMERENTSLTLSELNRRVFFPDYRRGSDNIVEKDMLGLQTGAFPEPVVVLLSR